MTPDQLAQARAVLQATDAAQDSALAAAFMTLFQEFLAGLVSVAIYKLIRTEDPNASRARRYAASTTALTWLAYCTVFFIPHKDIAHLAQAIGSTFVAGGTAWLIGAARDGSLGGIFGSSATALKDFVHGLTVRRAAHVQVVATAEAPASAPRTAVGPRRIWVGLAVAALGIGAVETRYERFGPGNRYLFDRWLARTCVPDDEGWKCNSVHDDPWRVASQQPISAAPKNTTATNPDTGQKALLVDGQWRSCSALDMVSANPWNTNTARDQVASTQAFQAASAAQQIETKNRYFAEVLVPRTLAEGGDQELLTGVYLNFMRPTPETSADSIPPWERYKAARPSPSEKQR